MENNKASVTDDEKVFGSMVWVYCDQHLAPHLTGWCTVFAKNKTKLEATNQEAAFEECRRKGYKLYIDGSK